MHVSVCVFHRVSGVLCLLESFLVGHELLNTQMFHSEAGIGKEELRKEREPSARP